MRRAARVTGLGLCVVASIGVSACVDPRPDEQACVVAPNAVLDVLTTQLTVPGQLRNGSLEIEQGITFVSAELWRDDDPETLRGDLLTWATGSLDGGEFFAVDVYARESSSWPPAPFDVREPGAIDSRACTAFRAGDPDPTRTDASTVDGGDSDGETDTTSSSIGF